MAGFRQEQMHVLRWQYEEYSTEALRAALNDRIKQLDELRANEPRMKKGKRWRHDLWIANSHDLLDEIQIIRNELLERTEDEA